jgi:hypothetical protein
LSLHTRPHGPRYEELLMLKRYMYEGYESLVKAVWRSLKMSYNSYLSDGTFQTYAIASCNIPDGVRVPIVWQDRWVSEFDTLEIRHWKLRFMISVDKYFREKQGDELKLMARLLEQHPKLLTKLGDPGQQPRPNIQHITQRLVQDAYRLGNIKFAVRQRFENFYEGESWFNTPSLAVQPLDKCMWFFLECRAQTYTPPQAIANDMEAVEERLLHFNRPFDHEHLPRLLRNPDENKLVGRLKHLSDHERKLHIDYQIGILDKTERRPVFTRAVKGEWAQKCRRGSEHPVEDIQWLEAFLRCCEYFLEQYPQCWTAVGLEAAKKYPICPKAEQRQKARDEKKRERGGE